jgi:hypothetical protein
MQMTWNWVEWTGGDGKEIELVIFGMLNQVR